MKSCLTSGPVGPVSNIGHVAQTHCHVVGVSPFVAGLVHRNHCEHEPVETSFENMLILLQGAFCLIDKKLQLVYSQYIVGQHIYIMS